MPRLPLLALLLLPSTAIAQASAQPTAQPTAQPLTLPAGTQLPLSTPAHLPMRIGTPIQAHLLYSVYAENKLVLPADTIVNGTIESLKPDRSRRNQARLRADFTPFYTPIVRFTSVILPNGTSVPISTGTATDGAPIYRLVTPPRQKGGFIAKGIATLKQAAKDRIAVITAPDKLDRIQQAFYNQLPYHPQRIAKATAWTVETTAPVDLEPQPLTTLPGNFATPAPAPTPASTDAPPTWILQAFLTTPISSETSKSGQPISAIVAEPILAADGSVTVPEGAILTGTVTSARPSRKFSRAGELHFAFKQLTLPGAEPQSVRVALKGVDSASDAQLAMTSEGEVKPKPQDHILVPALLFALASRPLDHDRRDGREGGNQFGKDAVASNSLGLIGFIIGTAAQQPNIASGIGYYGTALSIYQRIFAKGKPVAFPADTRVVLETTATRSAAMKPNTPPRSAEN